MANQINTAIIPSAGLGTRFLPLSKVINKEFWPLVDKPIIQYIIEEAAQAKIKKIILVLRPGDKTIINYLKKNEPLENILRKKKNKALLDLLKNLEKLTKKISFLYTYQNQPLGDGQAVKQASKLAGKKPCLVLFNDDLVEAKINPAQQLIKIFNQYQKPIVGLYRLPKEKLGSYGVVKVKKIKPRLYQIKEIIEKPTPRQIPSNLAIVGKYAIEENVFNFLEKSSPLTKGELRLSRVFNEMIKKGFTIYGYELKGRWLECGNKLAYLKSNLYLCLKHPQFGPRLKQFLKQEKLI